MNAYLKVKISSLAAEARIIRNLERARQKAAKRRAKPLADDPLFWGLRGHRTGAVRSESRSAGLAYSFLRGKIYDVVESERTRSTPDFKRVSEIAAKFATGDKRETAQRYEEWETRAKEVCKLRLDRLRKEEDAIRDAGGKPPRNRVSNGAPGVANPAPVA